MREMARFSNVLETRIRDVAEGAEQARIALMDEVAQAVHASGGNCDELLLMTAFFGGIHPGMSWDSPQGHDDDMIAGKNLPEAVDTALEFSQDLGFGVLEPYVVLAEHAKKPSHIGLVLPGESGKVYSCNVADVSFDSSKSKFEGTLAFNALKRSKGETRREMQTFLELSRTEGSGDTAAYFTSFALGVAAVRRYVGGPLPLKPMEESNAVDEQISSLRQAGAHMKSRPAKD